jgi:polar amino acid transport system substrate-binding protein
VLLDHPQPDRRLGARTVRLLLALLLLCPVLGCAGRFPADPDHTLDRVTGGVLRVGASPHDPWIVWAGEPEPTGREADVVRRFATTLDAEVAWSRGAEEELIARMERGELELVVAGLTAKTPWVDKAAVTKPYAEAIGPDGSTEQHVLAAPMGENAFLVALERFLEADREAAGR